eukprot:m.32781 g.32781  ORF g.32781 m.32781 type:complete len:490 (-) comp7097_c0_seq1:225-1694(-)
MATPEQLALFRKQTKELLTPAETKGVKEALGEFMEDKDVPMLVASLENVIDTAEKHVLFETIGCFVPPHYREDYFSHCPTLLKRDASYRRNSAAKDAKRLASSEGSANNGTGADVGRPPPVEVPQEIPSSRDGLAAAAAPGPTVYKHHTPAATTEPSPPVVSSPTVYKKHVPVAAAPPLESALQNRSSSFSAPPPAEKAPTRSQPAEPIAAAALPADDPDEAYMELAPNQLDEPEPSPQRTASVGGGGKLPPLRPPEAMMVESAAVPEDAYLLGCITRQDAESMLTESGLQPGTFLVRQKDDLSSGSMRLKPGQVAAGGSWVLSYVAPSSAFSHQLIIQEERGGVLEVGGKDLGRCTTLDHLIRHLRGVEGYALDRPPYHAQPWYHGDITREDAERRLYKGVPVPGTYLVRRSLRESSAWVLSMLNQMGVAVHNMIRLSPDGWHTDDEPSYLYDHLPTLLLANAHPNGFRLAAICGKPRPVGRRRQGGR